MITTKELKIVAGLEVLPCARGRGDPPDGRADEAPGGSAHAWAWVPVVIAS